MAAALLPFALLAHLSERLQTKAEARKEVLVAENALLAPISPVHRFQRPLPSTEIDFQKGEDFAMKGRSHHRLPISEPPDDWGDGSWTVDCVCGVTFDDGEEMVNCDECGVWVHTRCSRFVRGEKSFACDKCKGKRGRGNNDNSEETEVAQLLIELPHKTVHVGPPPVPDPPRRRFRLWTDIPMEERVHVQGAPGGDPALLRNVSSVFTSQLWKCTGFVPKKFNFQYREFPCWEEEKRCEPNAAGPDEENENPADRGANVLFALSKDIFPCAPQMETKDSLRGLVEVAGCEWKLSPKEKRQQGSKGGSGSSRMQNWAKKERNHLRPAGVHLGKRKKEVSGRLKDRSGKKKARNSDKEDGRSGSTPVGNAHALEYQEGDIKVAKSQDFRNENQIEAIRLEPNLNCQLPESNDDYPMKSASSIRASADPLCGEISGHDFALDSQVKAEDSEQHDPTSTTISPKGDAVGSPADRNHVAKAPIEAEVEAFLWFSSSMAFPIGGSLAMVVPEGLQELTGCRAASFSLNVVEYCKEFGKLPSPWLHNTCSSPPEPEGKRKKIYAPNYSK
ncbi:hypothetical protein ACLOJK_006322 [Asimina triloba]